MQWTLIHATPQSSLDTIMQKGLVYGSSGRSSQESHAQKTNALLDTLRPDFALRAQLSRQDCLYAFLVLEDKLLDVESGTVIALGAWRPAEDAVALRVSADPSKAWLGDLDTYDRLAAAIEQDEPVAALHELADLYWQQLIRLDEALEHYRLHDAVLTKKETAPAHMPRRFNRTEVLLTASIPPEAIQQLD